MSTPFRIAAATGLAALLVLAGSCSNLPTDTAAPGKAGGDVRLALVDNARWSMSAHNMQPWEVALDQADPLALTVSLANGRLLPETDPYSRQLIMSVGGFLALIEDAAAERGYQTELSLFPEGELPPLDGGESFQQPVARVKLRSPAAAATPAYLDALSSATVKADLGAPALPSSPALPPGASPDTPARR